ncbi:MAG: tRNA (N(6)-L-threonylcarbamoyladenosine(37)-C(2))-methylthiotransferase MtaB [candidate division Zixibacteria bacterium]|nr:tRNA (N(6)-L-threonylcarbamoyladenosine(37)-C(2))-methylthiotransferase MtaB [candidate division Zixibacteria bacterium]
MPKVSLTTIGCKLNQYETEAIASGLVRRGWEKVPFSQNADLCVINTCTVTNQADQSSRQAISQAHRRSPQAKIVVTGCYAQIAREQLKELPGVGLVIGSDYKDRLPNVIEDWLAGRPEKELESERAGTAYVEQKEFSAENHIGHTRAFVKIQNGCQEWCSFCVIPMTRGPERSRPLDWVVSEVESLVEKGFKEVVITGVHIGKYEWEGNELVDLLKAILERTQIRRIRLSSIKPREVTPELVDLIAGEERFCRHLHLPLQSGDKRTLERMKRKYTLEEFDSILHSFAEKIPEITLGTDVIVGFPGETEAEFASSCRYIENSPLNFLHVFSYSDRSNTLASEMEGKIDPVEINRRSAVLRELGNKKWQAFMDGFAGKTLLVLVEIHRGRQNNLLTGLADNYIRVNFGGPDTCSNQIVPVRILKREGTALFGNLTSGN